VNQAASSAKQDARRVLIADDEESIRLLVRMSLELEGIGVVEAEDGHRAVELARADPPDAVILDILMPSLDGWGVAEALRAHEATVDVPIIFLTALADMKNQRRAEAAGAWFIAKPFNPFELAAIVQGAIAGGRRSSRTAPVHDT